MRHEAQQVIPDREALAQMTLLYTGPEVFIIKQQNFKISKTASVFEEGEDGQGLLCFWPDGVDDDDVIHHDDDPGQAAEDEDDGDHDEDQGQPLLAFTEVTEMSPQFQGTIKKDTRVDKYIFLGWKYVFDGDVSVPDNFFSEHDILGLDSLWELKGVHE